jgi:hypothetical protein
MREDRYVGTLSKHEVVLNSTAIDNLCVVLEFFIELYEDEPEGFKLNSHRRLKDGSKAKQEASLAELKMILDDITGMGDEDD